MFGADHFGPDFQRQLVRACIDDPGLMSMLTRFIAAGQLGWTDPGCHWAWGVMAGSEYPSLLQLRTEFGRLTVDDPGRVGAQSILTIGPDWRDQEYVRNAITEWARHQVFLLGFEEARESWNQGDKTGARDKMLRRIEEMDSIRLETADRGWFFEELPDREIHRRRVRSDGDYFPSGVDKLDRAMGGGLHRGQLEVPLAYSGIGKTFWCVQRGFVGARIRKKVLHFVLEGGRTKTEERYDTRWAEMESREIRRGELPGYVMDRMMREYRILKGNLVIRGFADHEAWRITYDEILAELSDLRRINGWVPDLIIVDYGDLVWAPGDNETSRQKIAFQQLKSLSDRQDFRGHLGYAVCAPSQAQRPSKGADKRKHILRPRDVADCYAKVKCADVIVTLNRTVDEKALRLARVHLGKYRDDEDGLTVRVRTDYARGAFSVMGIPEPTAEDEPEDGAGGDDA